MKILLLGDASNYNVALGEGLKALGHSVTIASDGSKWMKTRRDIDLSRRNGKLGGALLYIRIKAMLDSRLSGYDVVQLSSPGFVRLRPKLLAKIFKHLKQKNGKIFLTALGTDNAYVRNLTGEKPALAYSEWNNGDKITYWAVSPESKSSEWLADDLEHYTDMVYENVDGVVSALYEYHRVVQAEFPDIPLHYGGIPIVTSALPEVKHDFDAPLNILYAAHRGREGEKGADRLLSILQSLAVDMPQRIKLVMPENMPYDRFVNVLGNSHVVSDQLYSYTPATTALLAMAMGTVPISGGEEEYYDFIGEHQLRPIFNPTPDNDQATMRRLAALISDPEQLKKMSDQGRQFVLRHNDAPIVAARFLEAWS